MLFLSVAKIEEFKENKDVFSYELIDVFRCFK